jgi:MarR family.
MSNYTVALALLIFIAVLTIANPRLAPITARAGAVIIIILAALWLYDRITSRPPPLANTVLRILKAKGPMTPRQIAIELETDTESVEKALEYLAERGLIRRYKKEGEFYYDI